MPNLKEVKTRINSVISTQQITKAMKMVAAAKLRKAQDRIIQMRPYSQKLTTILQNVSAGLDDGAGNVYGQEGQGSKVLVIVITSDRGLCGAFNANVIKAANRLIADKYSSEKEKGDIELMPIGKKAHDFYKRREYSLIEDHAFLFGELSFDSVRKVAESVMKAYAEGEYGRVELVYNEFKNVATQILRVEQFLPIVGSDNEEEVSAVDYIYEPSVEFIVGELIPKSLKIQLYKALLESNAAEHGARMTAMDKATENAGELLDDLKLAYNRTRQAAITKELSEIVAGAEALD